MKRECDINVVEAIELLILTTQPYIKRKVGQSGQNPMFGVKADSSVISHVYEVYGDSGPVHVRLEYDYRQPERGRVVIKNEDVGRLCKVMPRLANKLKKLNQYYTDDNRREQPNGGSNKG